MADSPVDTALAETLAEVLESCLPDDNGEYDDDTPLVLANVIARLRALASVPARSPDGWQEFRCAHSHRWQSEDKPTRCPVCNTSTFRSAGDGDEQ